MALLAYNLTAAPVVLAAGGVTLPAGPGSGRRGSAINVSSELKNLSGANYAALEAQRPSTVDYEWTAGPEFPIGTLSVDSAPGVAIPVAADGAAHVYAATDGDDGNDGLSAAAAYASIQKAFDRAMAWREADEDLPVAVHIADGDYVEYLTLNFSAIPKKDFIIQGDRATMEVIATGTTTAGSATSITDSGAAFGTADELVAYILHLRNLSDLAGSERWATVRSHTATVLNPLVVFTNGSGPTPGSGLAYDVLRPRVRISNPGTRPGRATLEITQPGSGKIETGGSSTSSDPTNQSVPFVKLAWLELQNADTSAGAIHARGGSVDFVGVVLSGTEGGLVGVNTFVRSGTQSPAAGDPVFDLPASNSWKLGAAVLGVRSTGASRIGIALENSRWLAPICCTSPGGVICKTFSQMIAVNGGRIANGGLKVESAQFIINSSIGSSLPFLIDKQGAGFLGAIEVALKGSMLMQGATKFDTITNAAVRLTRDSFARFTSTNWTLNAITGYTLDVQNGSKAQIGSGVAPGTGTAGEIRCDAVTGDFANLVVDTPLVGVNSGARAWRESVA